MPFIYNADARPHTIGLAGKEGRPGSSLMLKPGVNQVPDAKWSEAMKNPLIANMLASKILEQRGGSPAGEEAGGTGDLPPLGRSAQTTSGEQRDQTETEHNLDEEEDALVGLKVEEATSLIKDTLDAKLLERWRQEESKGSNRKGVLSAISSQLEVLKLEAEDSDEV